MWAAPSHGLVLNKWKGERGLSSSVHFSLLLDCSYRPTVFTTGCALRLESSRRAFSHTDFVRDAVTALRKVTDGHRTKEDVGKRGYLQAHKDSKLHTLVLPFFDSHGKQTLAKYRKTHSKEKYRLRKQVSPRRELKIRPEARAS